MASHGNDRVLSTLNRDGSRRFIRPTRAKGRFERRRRILAYSLMAVFVAIPHLKVWGKPLILLDLTRREFTVFGATFLATDTVLLMLLLVSIALTIFLLTALWGRVWCGWACPQTVYLEFLFRPIERLIEGNATRQRKLDLQGPNLRRVIKQVVFVVLTLGLAHTFLAYFVGVDRLAQWVWQSPLEHPAAFMVMAATSTAMFIDFAWFREQLCIVACPYGRFQAVLLDRHSMIVGYDEGRGEPRGKPHKRGRNTQELKTTEGQGDCIDCGACVRCCPTGIDIRDGLQMECIGCVQCVDACDAIMDKVRRRRGLIRYTSKAQLAGANKRLLRPRVVVYPLLLTCVLGGLVAMVGTRSPAKVTVLRGRGAPFSKVADRRVSNHLEVTVVNRTDSLQSYQIGLVDGSDMSLVAPRNPLPVTPGASETTPVFVVAPRDSFKLGERRITLRITDGGDFRTEISYRLLGPMRH